MSSELSGFHVSPQFILAHFSDIISRRSLSERPDVGKLFFPPHRGLSPFFVPRPSIENVTQGGSLSQIIHCRCRRRKQNLVWRFWALTGKGEREREGRPTAISRAKIPKVLERHAWETKRKHGDRYRTRVRHEIGMQLLWHMKKGRCLAWLSIQPSEGHIPAICGFVQSYILENRMERS